MISIKRTMTGGLLKPPAVKNFTAPEGLLDHPGRPISRGRIRKPDGELFKGDLHKTGSNPWAGLLARDPLQVAFPTVMIHRQWLHDLRVQRSHTAARPRRISTAFPSPCSSTGFTAGFAATQRWRHHSQRSNSCKRVTLLVVTRSGFPHVAVEAGDGPAPDERSARRSTDVRRSTTFDGQTPPVLPIDHRTPVRDGGGAFADGWPG